MVLDCKGCMLTGALDYRRILQFQHGRVCAGVFSYSVKSLEMQQMQQTVEQGPCILHMLHTM